MGNWHLLTRDGRLFLELCFFGRTGQGGRPRFAAADELGNLIEVAGPDFELVACGGVAERLACEFAYLEVRIRAHAARCKIVCEREHAVVECVKTGERDELEAVTHCKERVAKARDRRFVEFCFPVERRRAVVREHLVQILRVDAVGEPLRFCKAGVGSLAPDQVAVRRVGESARDRLFDPGVDAGESLGRVFAGAERSLLGCQELSASGIVRLYGKIDPSARGASNNDGAESIRTP
jgi:hypothetical protein